VTQRGARDYKGERMQSGERRGRGFTLIELIVAVAVVAILAALAFPSYTSYVRRGKIAAALGELTSARVKLEQYYQDNRNYGSTAGTCGVALPTATGFTFSCNWGAGGTSQSFLLTATGQDSLAGYVYTIDQSDAQRTEQFDGQAVGLACWITKKGQSC
jgi:type IV pilus assembly protein PilE